MFWRILALVNATVTLFLLWVAFDLYRLSAELGAALVYYSEVLEEVARHVFKTYSF